MIARAAMSIDAAVALGRRANRDAVWAESTREKISSFSRTLGGRASILEKKGGKKVRVMSEE